MLKIFVFMFLLAIVVHGAQGDEDSSDESDDHNTEHSGGRAHPRLPTGGSGGGFEQLPDDIDSEEEPIVHGVQGDEDSSDESDDHNREHSGGRAHPRLPTGGSGGGFEQLPDDIDSEEEPRSP
uniref:Putative secreted protein n=1 Tax=Amblyomma cajennense TaxID=34607 RepID=A0A023FDP8_AMBCJ